MPPDEGAEGVGSLGHQARARVKLGPALDDRHESPCQSALGTRDGSSRDDIRWSRLVLSLMVGIAVPSAAPASPNGLLNGKQLVLFPPVLIDAEFEYLGPAQVRAGNGGVVVTLPGEWCAHPRLLYAPRPICATDQPLGANPVVAHSDTVWSTNCGFWLAPGNVGAQTLARETVVQVRIEKYACSRIRIYARAGATGRARFIWMTSFASHLDAHESAWLPESADPIRAAPGWTAVPELEIPVRFVQSKVSRSGEWSQELDLAGIRVVARDGASFSGRLTDGTEFRGAVAFGDGKRDAPQFPFVVLSVVVLR